MAKRFTDTLKFQKQFYKKLPSAYKLLWEYILCDCDCAGIWIVEPEIAQIRIGKELKIDIDKAFELFNQDELRVVEIEHNSKWFIVGFIKFQYGNLNPKSSIFKGKSVLNAQSSRFNIALASPPLVWIKKSFTSAFSA